MIPLERNRTEDDIHANFLETNRVEFETELMNNQRSIAKGDLDKHSFKGGRWTKAKPQLVLDTHGKCAYCETPTTVVAYGAVEHYRPKSKYWWIAYCYDNYLMSCTLCNSKYKVAKFSIKSSKLKCPVRIRANTSDSYIGRYAGKLGPDPLDKNGAVNDFKQEHLEERPYLPNPYVDDPDDFYAWELDDTLRQVKLIAAEGIEDAEQVVKAAEEDLGLNRPELLDLRYQTLTAYRIYLKVTQSPGIDARLLADTQAELAKMTEPGAAYAGMVRYFSRNTHLL
ncbi:MAG: hypothetical protein AAF662_04240 [Pseudomonadota bacterium]